MLTKSSTDALLVCTANMRSVVLTVNPSECSAAKVDRCGPKDYLPYMRSILLLALIAAALAPASPAPAQELAPGTRVRITAPIVRGDSRFVGTVTSTEGGRIRLRLDPAVRQDSRLDTISIPRNLIRRVEVSLGRGTGGGRVQAAR